MNRASNTCTNSVPYDRKANQWHSQHANTKSMQENMHAFLHACFLMQAQEKSRHK